MAYLCVDRTGEYIADNIPVRNFYEWTGWENVYGESCTLIMVPKGTIKKLIGRDLTWRDEPFELPLNMFTNGKL